MTMNNLANRYYNLGRSPEALKLRQETLALRKVKLGPDHPDTLMTMNNLANSYYILGRRPEALKLRQETLALRKVKLGPDHPDTLMTMYNLAISYTALGRNEAVRLIDDCVRRAAGKVVDPRLLPTVLDLRLRYFEQAGDPAGCRQTAEKWEALNRTDAASLYSAACMRAVTAAVLRAADQPAEADAEAERAIAWLKRAVAAGFNNASRLKRDKDLDALRDRADFSGLVTASPSRAP
jgi:tetratricopeptide (TPR) repeat protein